MAPIAKENDTLTLPSEPSIARPAAGTADAGAKPQPVALEVPVTVNGARSVDGSDKREPFSESTKTILVFGNGAVIRLESSVAPGQLLFLTNEKTKKEVVCQVVKSKNYRSMSGYVELEFTEPVVGFWGMRFPGDRIAPQAPAPASGAKLPEPKPAPVATKTAATLPVQKPVGAAHPEAAANFNALKSLISPPAAPASDATKSLAPKSQLASSTQSPNPVAPSLARNPAPNFTPAPADPATDALKQQTARLQEQLSSMLFQEARASNSRSGPEREAKNADSHLVSDAPKVFEIANAEPAAAEPQKHSMESPPPPARKTITPASGPALHEDDLKIPSWLAPLAQNAANASAVSEAAAKPGVLSEAPIFEEHIASELPASSQHSGAAEMPSFSGGLLSQDSSVGASASATSASKGLKLLAVAAGILVAAAAGTWYIRTGQPAAPAALAASSAAESTTRVSDSASATPSRTAAEPVAGPPVATAPAREESSTAEPTPAATHTVTPAQPSHAATAKATVPERVRTEESKKPTLGEVHLAAPTAASGIRNGSASDPVPAVDLGASEPVAENGLVAVLPSGRKQPAAPPAPIPVGGDVKPARLISSTPPLYPSLAKTQRVSGNVVIDALIDATGRVTTMKIVSGPTLLHQAAMDALRQWKYQPATLDGKPVPMHLTVSLQFRLD